ncbi:MAG: TonB-dependent receptor, partial [Rhodanobacter sp.]
MAVTTAFAQNITAPQSAAQTAINLQAVEVTGSRIKGADMATQVPTVTISATELEKTGITNIGDILQQLSSSGAGLNTKFNSSGNFGAPPGGNGIGAGSSTLDLRNLGSNRVLILVDGVRWVNESSGSGVSGAVDMNTIPAGIIDHIEILQDGASALYGSDAIAGVVNIITKKSQKGGSIDTYYGNYSDLNGAPTTTTNFSFGNKNDRFQYFVNISHLKQAGMAGAVYGPSSVCVPGIPASDKGECSSTSPGGSITLIDPATGARHKVITNDGVTGAATYPGDFHKFTNDDRFNYAPYNLLLTPSERSSVFTSFQYDINDNVKWYARALYNNRKSTNEAAPNPLTFGADGGSETFTDHINIDATNPFNPFGRTLVSGVDYGTIQKRMLQEGTRVFLQDVNTTYFTTGLQGHFDVGERSLFWDVNYADGINKASASQVRGAINLRNVQRALGPIAGCTDTCVPLNLFGANSITPAMLDYIQYDAVDRSQNKIQLFTANLSGEVFDLPAGPFSFAAGGEHRKYSGYFFPNPLTHNGDDGSIPVPNTSGGYSINEGYLEVHIPVLANVPFFKALDVSAATRYSDYSNFGGTVNSKLGVRWQVVNDLTLRSTVAQGFRAPALGELYAPPSGFGATLLDPCTEPVASAAIGANCRALGVPAGYQQNNTQITVNTGGNANLKPETARSVTAGAVYSPSWATGTGWADRFDLTAGYYRIKVTNAIAALDSQTVLDDCVASGSSTSD